MSEQTPEQPAPEPAQEVAEPERTGVDEVDEVLDSVEGLDDIPVDEHVVVFERAHERLRGALDGPSDA